MLRGTPARILCTLFTSCVIALVGCSDRAGTEVFSGGHAAGNVDALTTQPAELTPIELREGEELRLVATTSIVADVVKNVGGESIEVITLIPLGADPHTFQPSPGDLRSLADAHAIFINGVGLEDFLFEVLAQVADDVPIVSLSVGITPLQFGGDGSGGQDGDGGHDGNDHRRGDDPHVWFDPVNTMIWAENASLALSALDVDNHGQYEENARQYVALLEELQRWIEDQVAGVPERNRELVTDHLVFNYFAQRYGFKMVGAVIPAYSTAAEPSARELSELKDAIQATDVQALFVGMTVNPRLTEMMAEDTGVNLVPLYTGSLSETGGPADTYLRFMRYDVSAIIQALGE